MSQQLMLQTFGNQVTTHQTRRLQQQSMMGDGGGGGGAGFGGGGGKGRQDEGRVGQEK